MKEYKTMFTFEVAAGVGPVELVREYGIHSCKCPSKRNEKSDRKS